NYPREHRQARGTSHSSSQPPGTGQSHTVLCQARGKEGHDPEIPWRDAVDRRPDEPEEAEASAGAVEPVGGGPPPATGEPPGPGAPRPPRRRRPSRLAG